jgi:deoxyribonuclease V
MGASEPRGGEPGSGTDGTLHGGQEWFSLLGAADYVVGASSSHRPRSAPMQVDLQYQHDWDVSPDEAKRIQRRLASEVRETPLPDDVATIAGVDVSVRDDIAQAAIAVLQRFGLTVVDRAVHRCEVPFPYVPGLLSFREMPAVLPALEQLGTTPDVFVSDSHGRAHPRRFGLACHMGVLLGVPTIGVAKSILVGEPHGELSAEKGSRVPLVDDGETVGTVLRTRTDVNPVYVSVGHRCTLDDAADLMLDCSPTYKIPEPTRQAHRLSRAET